MSEEKIKIRRLGFGLRFFIMFSFILCLASLFFIPPVFEYLLGAGVLALLVLAVVYFRIPKAEVYLFNKKGNFLYFTSMQNPIYGVGESYLPSEMILIENIVRITIYRQYVYRVGVFTFVRFYMEDGSQYTVWLDIKHEQTVLENIQKILQEKDDIEVFCPDESTYRVLTVFGSRVFNKIAPPMEDTVSTKINYKNKFSEGEWQELLDVPVRIFLFIAKGDGVVSEQEIKKLTVYLHSSQSQRSLLFSEILHTLSEKMDDIRFDFEQGGFCESITNLVGQLSLKIEKTEVEDLKKGLLDFAYGIAKADRPSGAAPRIVEEKLNELQSCLLLSA